MFIYDLTEKTERNMFSSDNLFISTYFDCCLPRMRLLSGDVD